MNNRRNTIKKLGLGTVWATPIVQSLVLPAHAQTSPTTTATPTTTITPTTTTTTTTTTLPPCSSDVNVNASFNSTGTVFGINDRCQQISSGGMVDMSISDYITSTNPINGAPQVTYVIQPINVTTTLERNGVNGDVQILTITDQLGRQWQGFINLFFDGNQITVTGTLSLI